MKDQPELAGTRSMTRRQALKRGAVVGGALAWTVPAVQAVSMTSAHADAASAPPVRAGSVQPVSEGGMAPALSSGELSSTGTPVVATVAVGTGLLIGGAAITAAVKAQAAAGLAGAGSTGGGATESVIPPPPTA